MIAGFCGGVVDNIIMRLVDILCTFPPPPLVSLAVIGILGPRLPNIMLVLVTLWWAPLGRMIRSEVPQDKEKAFILVAKASMQPFWKKIIFKQTDRISQQTVEFVIAFDCR